MNLAAFPLAPLVQVATLPRAASLTQAAAVPLAQTQAGTPSLQPGANAPGFLPIPTETAGSSLLRDSSPGYHYNRPFLQPAPVWNYWFALLFPLLLIICIVYKGVKVAHIRELPKQAAAMFGWLVLSLAAAALALQLFVRWTS